MKLAHPRLGTKTAGVAALAVALAATAAPAWACGDVSVPLPGSQPVKNEPAHHGVPTLSLTFDHGGVAAGTTGWEIHLTETNRTGAAYTHITPIIGVFGSGLDPKDTFMSWMNGDNLVPMPVRGSCDPTVWLNSAALDGPLANGASRTFELYVSTPSSDALHIKNFQVVADASADGTNNLLSNTLEVTNAAYEGPAPTSTTPGAQPTTGTGRPTTAPPSTAPATASPRPTASAAPSTAAPATPAPTGPAPTATATATGALASTGGGSDTGLLAGTALLLLGAGAAVTVALRRRNRHS